VLLAASSLLAAGCAGVQRRPSGGDGRDPLERVNRATYAFNDTLDQYLFGPVSKAYVKITPQVVRTGVFHFFDNLTSIDVILNGLLQGKPVQALSDFWRFFVNSTVGLVGLFDVATPLGLERHTGDFGQTLGVWGAGEGVYLVLPILGPSSLRDAPGLAVSVVANPLFYVNDTAVKASATALKMVDERARLDSAIRVRDEAAVDPYLFTREAYRQRRLTLIYGGPPPRPSLEEEPEEGDDAPPEEAAPTNR
jgi:phospholipid-binding lipoprotein MlaA